MKRTILAAKVIEIFLVLLFFPKLPTVWAQPPAPEELPPQTPSALRGQAIFEARCTRCHGSQGAGDGEMVSQLPAAPPSFLDAEHMREVTPAQYFDIITNGNLQALMPPWRDELSTQERWDVLFYTWSLSTTRDQLQTGEKIYRQECATCHGDAGDKVAAIDLSDQAMMATLSQADLMAGLREGHSDAHGLHTLTDDEQRAVVDYVRTFTYDTVFSAAEAVGDGVIEGRVVGGSAGTAPDVASVELTLFPFVGQTSLPAITTTVEADGSFRFEGLPTNANRIYGLQATYRGVDYFHPEPVDLSESPSASVTLHVYETTTDGSAISVDRNHVIINFANNQLQVAELYIFQNAGDRTYVDSAGTLRFSLPSGAHNLRFQDPRMNQSTELVEGKIVDTLPVPPGSRQVLLSYNVPYEGRSIDFEKPIDYVTGSLNVFVADAGVDIDAGPLVAGQPVTAQSNTRFLNYSRQNVPAGEPLSIKLSNLPQDSVSSAASVPADRSRTLRWLGLGLVVLVVAFVSAYPSLRPRLLDEEALEDEAAVAMLRRRRTRLLEELANLDDAHAAGQVAENNYIDTRAEIKADLIDVMRQLRRLEETES